MNRRALFAGIAAAASTFVTRRRAQAGRHPQVGFPTVIELERELTLVPGGEFPKEVVSNGKVYRAFYVGAEQGVGGRYTATIQLVRN